MSGIPSTNVVTVPRCNANGWCRARPCNR
jgi:hypothetical protein